MSGADANQGKGVSAAANKAANWIVGQLGAAAGQLVVSLVTTVVTSIVTIIFAESIFSALSIYSTDHFVSEPYLWIAILSVLALALLWLVMWASIQSYFDIAAVGICLLTFVAFALYRWRVLPRFFEIEFALYCFGILQLAGLSCILLFRVLWIVLSLRKAQNAP